MRISVCYIVKNEAANLTRSLSTVKDFADELIVADTGSADASKEIAARAGAKGLDFARRPEIGSFSLTLTRAFCTRRRCEPRWRSWMRYARRLTR